MTPPRERLPFVSGLPGDLATLAPADGMDMLARIRARAADDSEALARAATRYFDGEWHEPDPQAVAAKAEYDAIVAMVDGIMADRVLQLRIGAMLARRRG